MTPMPAPSQQKRERRLSALRPISDPDHGHLGHIQRVGTNRKGLCWAAVYPDGSSDGLFHTGKDAIDALCDRAGVPRWFRKLGVPA